MKKDELIKKIDRKECHLLQVVHDLIRKAISEDEEILGKYLKTEKAELEKGKIQSIKYAYYIVTNRNFIVISAFEKEYWYKACPLNRFMVLEEKTTPPWETIVKQDAPGVLLVEDTFPGRIEVKICFDVNDEYLRKITLTIEKDAKKPEIGNELRAFVSALATVRKNL